MMFRVELEAEEWSRVLNAMSNAPYREIAPLIGKMSQQLQQSAPPGNGEAPPVEPKKRPKAPPPQE